MRKSPNDIAHEPVRTCILSGEKAAPATLVRLAIAPDGAVAPDVHAKAPGRGAWLGVSRAELETAMAKGRLRGALARSFKGAPLSVPDDLPDLIEAALRKALAERLGLEARGGTLVTGSDRIDMAARQGRVALLLHAMDAGSDGAGKLAQAMRVGNDREGSGDTGTVLPLDRVALSMALGRENAVHAAITDHRAAERVKRHLLRLRHFLGEAPNMSGPAPVVTGGEPRGHPPSG